MGAVVFDLFETLITEWGAPKYTNQEVAADLGIDPQVFRGESAKLQAKRYSGEISDTIQFYKIILERLGIQRDENLLQAIAAKREACKRKCFGEISSEILDLLTTIKNNGYKIGLISNCSAEEVTGLKNSALYPFFDAVVLSCDVGLVKPDVKIYEHCASLLQVAPSECYFVGDGGSDELNGANNAGMTPLQALWFIKHFTNVQDLPQEYPAFADVTDFQGGFQKSLMFSLSPKAL